MNDESRVQDETCHSELVYACNSHQEHWDCLGVNFPAGSDTRFSNLALSTAYLPQRAPPAQDSPGYAISDSSTGTTPNSPQTPPTPTWREGALPTSQQLKGFVQATTTEKERHQCASRQDQQRSGVQVSMSQREPASRPASCRNSASPGISAEPEIRHSGPTIGSNDAFGERFVHDRDRAGAGQNISSSKSLGMLHLLNPSNSRIKEIPGISEPVSKLGSGHPSTAHHSSSHGTPRGPAYGNSASASYPGTPNYGQPLMGTERQSPVLSHPFTGVQDTRQVLSPKVPRPASIGHGSSLSRDFDTRSQAHVPATTPAKRPHESDPADDPRKLPGLHHQIQGVNFVAGSQSSTPPTRSLSQRGARPIDAAYVPSHSGPSRDMSGGRPNVHAQFQSGPSLTNLPSVTRPPDGSSSWTEVMRRSVIGAPGGIEGQQAFMTLPGSDTPIAVQVDYSQASRKADEKRQRNAKASTRHRRKKKTIQEENVRQLQDLKEERQYIADELEQMRHQRDFYRDERNRLRDIVSRTPGIHQHAAGPPSPSPTRSTGSNTDHSPITQHHATTPAPGYMGEFSAPDRPPQRPKAEEPSDYACSSFVPSLPPSTIASAHNQPYGTVPQRPPSAASSGSGEKLPPLRAMEGPPPIMQHVGSGQAHEQDPRTGQWRPVPPRQVETGWATAPRKTGDKPGQPHLW